MTTVRTEGWSVRPSFTPRGATSPVTLLGDDVGLTQLSGEPPVAWQTPWTEVAALQLVRLRHGMVLFATIDSVRYSWRTRRDDDVEAMSTLTLERGGLVIRRPRRFLVVAVVAVVLLATLSGGLAALLSRGGDVESDAQRAGAVNLSIRDLPPGWFASSNSYLSGLFQSGTINDTVPTTISHADESAYQAIGRRFQECVGVGARRDREFGAAAQSPVVQVTSPVFESSGRGEIDVATSTQYYASTTMVAKDTAEMRLTKFGGCFVAVNDVIEQYQLTSSVTTEPTGVAWKPITYVKGFAIGGEETISISGVSTPLHLVVVVVTGGHFESTLGALVSAWPASSDVLSTFVNTLKARVASTSAAAA